MADEPNEPVQEPVQDPVVEPEGDPLETPPAEEPISAEPHPLEPGGDRFKQVYARAKHAEEKADRLEREVSEMRTVQAQATQTTTQASLEQQVEAAVEAGTMTQLQAIKLLSRQYAKEEAKATVKQETQVTTDRQRLQEASNGIQAFVNVAPDIETLSHPKINEVKAHYNTLIQRGHQPGLPTELLSLEMTFGSPEKLKRARNPSDRTTTPMTSGGSSAPAAVPQGKSDLKGIPQRYISYWEARHYSHEDMVAESKYLTTEQKARKE